MSPINHLRKKEPKEDITDHNEQSQIEENTEPQIENADKGSFVHLHCHSQFSILQSTASVHDIVSKAKELNMPAVALTDHGNMFGAFQFSQEAINNDIKPIIGCEFYLCEDHEDKSNKDNGYHQVLIAKNKKGYQTFASSLPNHT